MNCLMGQLPDPSMVMLLKMPAQSRTTLQIIQQKVIILRKNQPLLVQAKVHLKQIKVNVIIGVANNERQKKQPLIIDASFEIDIQKSILSDNIKDTVDYAEVAEAISEIAQSTQFVLLEAFLSHLAKQLLNRFAIANLHLIVQKPFATKGLAQVSMEYFQPPCL